MLGAGCSFTLLWGRTGRPAVARRRYSANSMTVVASAATQGPDPTTLVRSDDSEISDECCFAVCTSLETILIEKIVCMVAKSHCMQSCCGSASDCVSFVRSFVRAGMAYTREPLSSMRLRDPTHNDQSGYQCLKPPSRIPIQYLPY